MKAKKQVIKKRGGGMAKVMKKRGGGMMKKMKSGGSAINQHKRMAMGENIGQ